MEEIRENDRLLRRVLYLDPNFIKPDGTSASSSFALKRDEDGLSVELERLTTYAKAIQDRSRFRLFALNAGLTKSPGLENIHDPLPDNPALALIKGTITRGMSRKLASAAVRVAFPT